jgi:hypothetical protein
MELSPSLQGAPRIAGGRQWTELSLKEVAQTLRVSADCLRRAAKDPEFPMPPASNGRPLRWTAGQVERLLWAPPDHGPHLQRSKTTQSRRRS